MAGLNKAAMARHLHTEHGGKTSTKTIEEMRRWTRDQLEGEHALLKTYGPCDDPSRGFIRACRECGCTEEVACVLGVDDLGSVVVCGWAGPDLCTNCALDSASAS